MTSEALAIIDRNSYELAYAQLVRILPGQFASRLWKEANQEVEGERR